MTRTKSGILASLLTLILLFTMITATLPVSVHSASGTLSSTVNIATADRNVEGLGYKWDNREDVLTLNGLHIDTDSPYGLRLPHNCTVILEGNNTIKAAKYGVACSGTIVFKGSGSLTIEAGEVGMLLLSQDDTHKVRIIDGKYTITAGKTGIDSEIASFSLAGGSMKITVPETGAYAINGRVVNLVGGSFSANAPVNGIHSLTVESIHLDITASAPALSGKNLAIDHIKLKNGGEYAGENAISATALAVSRTSLVFGETVPGWVDYILLVVLIGGIGAAIFGPALHRKKKAKALYERLAKEGYIHPDNENK